MELIEVAEVADLKPAARPVAKAVVPDVKPADKPVAKAKPTSKPATVTNSSKRIHSAMRLLLSNMTYVNQLAGEVTSLQVKKGSQRATVGKRKMWHIYDDSDEDSDCCIDAEDYDDSM
jgi:hypothetical protein